jgi:hypothetical protein
MTILIPDQTVHYEMVRMWWEGIDLHTVDRSGVHRLYKGARLRHFSIHKEKEQLPYFGPSPLLNIFPLMKEFEYIQNSMKGFREDHFLGQKK